MWMHEHRTPDGGRDEKYKNINKQLDTTIINTFSEKEK